MQENVRRVGEMTGKKAIALSQERENGQRTLTRKKVSASTGENTSENRKPKGVKPCEGHKRVQSKRRDHLKRKIRPAELVWEERKQCPIRHASKKVKGNLKPTLSSKNPAKRSSQ